MAPHTISAEQYPLANHENHVVSKSHFENGMVWINDSNYFEGVSKIAWDFSIGGYQPAQKWLKDRKGKKLTAEDVEHYQTIIRILSKTDQIMKTIEMSFEK